MKRRVLTISVVVFTLFFAVGARCYGATPAVAEPINVPVGQRQLFLDDYCVAKMDGLQKTMHQPVKKGAVIKPDRPWETCLQTRSAPAWDEKEQIYKMWVLTLAGAWQTAYLESKDGINWTKPILRQQAYQGSLENNLLQVPGVHDAAVVYDPDDPDSSRRYKGLFLAVPGEEPGFDCSFHPAVSPDGIHWTKLNVRHISGADEMNLSYDRLTRTFIATVKTGGPYGRSHFIWTSKDFAAWMNSRVVFSADAEDQRLAKTNIQARLANPKLQQPIYNNAANYSADIYNLGLFRYEGLYVGLPAVFHSTGNVPVRTGVFTNTDGFHLIQLACSRDLRTWLRLGDRQPFIGPSPVGQDVYDLMQILPPSAPVVRGDELWFYYTGLKHREPPENKKNYEGAGAICLAVLRRDGFISLDAAEKQGTLLTKPFVVRGTKLFVNSDATKGTLEVEVLDGHNKAVAVSEAVVGDQPRASVQWKSGDFSDLKGKTVSLRFKLKKANLYSFWWDE